MKSRIDKNKSKDTAIILCYEVRNMYLKDKELGDKIQLILNEIVKW